MPQQFFDKGESDNDATPWEQWNRTQDDRHKQFSRVQTSFSVASAGFRESQEDLSIKMVSSQVWSDQVSSSSDGFSGAVKLSDDDVKVSEVDVSLMN